MASLSIVRSHSLSHKAAREAAERIVRDLQRRFDLEYAWDGDDVTFERPGVSGHLHVGKRDIALEVKLGLLLGAIKGTIEREISTQFDALFAAPAATVKSDPAGRPAAPAKKAPRVAARVPPAKPAAARKAPGRGKS